MRSRSLAGPSLVLVLHCIGTTGGFAATDSESGEVPHTATRSPMDMRELAAGESAGEVGTSQPSHSSITVCAFNIFEGGSSRHESKHTREGARGSDLMLMWRGC